jgi:hypothetical protein
MFSDWSRHADSASFITNAELEGTFRSDPEKQKRVDSFVTDDTGHSTLSTATDFIPKTCRDVESTCKDDAKGRATEGAETE